MAGIFTIIAESEPVYSRFGDGWSCIDYLDWHKANKKKFGKERADSKMLSGFFASDAPDFFADRFDCPTGSDAFRKYFTEEGLFDSLSTGNRGVIDDLNLTIVDTVDNVTDTVEGVGEGLSNTGSVFKYALPIIAIIAVIILIQFFKARLNFGKAALSQGLNAGSANSNLKEGVQKLING